MVNKQEKVYRDSFDFWERMASDPSIILMEKMSYDLTIYKIPKLFKRISNDCFDKKMLHYSSIGGLPELKDIIREFEILPNKKLKNKDSSIFVGSGTSEVFYQYIKAILKLPENKDRKKFLIFKPGYLFFDISIERAGGKTIHVVGRQENRFVPSIDQIKKSISKDVCAVVIVNPNNPTGVAYSKDYLIEILNLAKKYRLFVVSDEVYTYLLKDEVKHTSILSINNSFERVVKIFGPVKDRAGFSGIRIGYGIGDKRLEKIILDEFVGQSLSGNIISEYLLYNDMSLRLYLQTGKKNKAVREMSKQEIEDYKTTIDYNKKLLLKLQGFVCNRLAKKPETFEYVEPDGCNMVFFCQKNLGLRKFEDLGVGLYDGDFFNWPVKNGKAWSRICLTFPKTVLSRGLKRLGC